ncbi:MAG: DMT family protein [Pirellulales bacterium]|nr:DMT family protein [Pirellulales bacterium]
MPMPYVYFQTAALLFCSNLFMTLAWYGHLRFSHSALWLTILASWLIALPEYCFQVPANRLGHAGGISSPQLKIMQEVISILAFLLFNWLYLREKVHPGDWLAFGLILAAVLVICVPRILSTAA